MEKTLQGVLKHDIQLLRISLNENPERSTLRQSIVVHTVCLRKKRAAITRSLTFAWNSSKGQHYWLQPAWPNVYKSCPKLISLEKLKILTPAQKLSKNVQDLGKLILAKGFEKFPKVQLITHSGHTGWCKNIFRLQIDASESLSFGGKIQDKFQTNFTYFLRCLQSDSNILLFIAFEILLYCCRVIF